jgi:predicted TIM-barrel fold metal-dependent hydrolase
MTLFDCNVCFGSFSVPPLQRVETAEALVAEMSHCGISRALVRHAAQIDESPEVGNPLLCRLVAPYPELVASWAILPFETGELGDLPQFLQAMRQHDVRALWAYPSRHRYLLNATTFGELFEEMTRRRIPLLLPKQEQSGGRAGWDLADAILGDFPSLRLIVVGHGSWGEDRYFRPLMRRYEGFCVDTSRYELDGGIAAACAAHGPERLLFGTAYPYTGMGGAMLTLLHADMPDEWKVAVAGGNLQRLLDEVNLG